MRDAKKERHQRASLDSRGLKDQLWIWNLSRLELYVGPEALMLQTK